jgi:Subtilase family/Secretion system C-terminal sorting domain
MNNRFFILIVLVLASFSSKGQQTQLVRLRTGDVQPPVFNTASVNSFNKTTPRFQNKGYGIIQFENIPDISEKKILASNGISLLEYLPDSAYTFIFEKELSFELLKKLGVTSVFSLSPEQKMDVFLSKGILPSWAITNPGRIDVLVKLLPSVNTKEVSSLLREKGFEVMNTTLSTYGILDLRVDPTQLKNLAALPFIIYVQAKPPKDKTLNRNSRNLSRANVLNASVTSGGKGLNGEGVVIGIGDNADVQFHIDFSGRLINRTSITHSVHGVHTTGTLAGAGNVNEIYRGYASKATIVSQVFSGILSNAATYVQDYGMVLTNNSYGNIAECDYHGNYDLYAQVLDQQAFDLPSLQNVFSAGNSGASTCAPYAQGFHTVLGSYQSAKNVLSVGATNDSGQIGSFSSRGPVKDGRIKPEITAMGQLVISTAPTNSYVASSGTSMASPAVTGGLALLYQRYRQLNAGANPPAALMKTLVCNGATDRGNAGPDFSYGFGNMSLLRSLDMLEKQNYTSSTIVNAQTKTHSITVPPNTAQVKVMLYWQDPPAAVIASRTLVNDLDLEILDPSSAVTLPRVPDTTAANLNLPAATAADHINNMEQVVIHSPVAGNFTARIKGTSITQNSPQQYFLVYDIIPESLKLTFPAGGEALLPGEQVKIQWDYYGDTTTSFALYYSIDSGANWTQIVSGLNHARRIFTWTVPSATTANAIVRVVKISTLTTADSYPFPIIGQPVISLASTQCESYASISWTAVPTATSYEVMRLVNDEMVTVATTTAINYTFSGLHKDSVYWFTVRPVIAGKNGRRAIAISRKPDSGNCAGSISDNDVKIEAITSPNSGRKFTSTELTSSTPISILIKNLDDAAVSGLTVKYSVNGGGYVTETVSATIAAGGTVVYTFATTADLSLPGNYFITAVVKNSNPDPVASNDTITKLVKQIDNPIINLISAFINDFETAIPALYTKDTMGLSGIERYDYMRTTISGRLRTFVNSGFAHSGTKAITMDADRLGAGNINYLIGTYNLSAYNAAVQDLRLDFFFLHHGQPLNAANMVWIRGNDSQPWIAVYDLDSNQTEAGVYKKTSSIELSRLLLANAQNFSSSFQVRWGQYGIQPASDLFAGNGYTIDDVRIYLVNNDIQMLSINEPIGSSCSLGTSTIIKVSVRNSSANTITNIPVRYRIDGGSWVIENIPSLAAYTTVNYSFLTPANLSAPGSHLIEVVADLASDSFRENDTARITIVNAPLINAYPYLENFESGNGNWYSAGKNSSWEFGTPASLHINSAAGGSKAWKTGLKGNYNDNELSYLYSPCFDISTLTNPTLSFSVALDIEDCGSTICDAAWVEYSADGIVWTKLGTSGQGVNWYNKATTQQIWSVQNYWRWHVAGFALPSGLTKLRLRFVFNSDVGVNREGIAIDDIHIYNNSKGIYKSPPVTGSSVQTPTAGQWTDFEIGGKLIASLKTNEAIGTTKTAVYIDTSSRSSNAQYIHPRNITIKPAKRETADSVTVRFYFTDAETEKLLVASGCGGCSKPGSAYELGVSKYTDIDTSFENGVITDDQQGAWTFIKRNELSIVPFDIGYYAEFKVKDFSEFWLNNGGLDRSSPLPLKLMEFFAKRVGADVLLTWRTGSESEIARYEIEVAKGDEALQSGNFVQIGQVTVAGNSTSTRLYSFTDTEPGKTGNRYYRLKIISTNGTVSYSPVRLVVFEDFTSWKVYPNPATGKFFLEFLINDQEFLRASVYDSKGRLMKQLVKTGTGGLQKWEIDLQAFAAGVYLLKLHSISGEHTFTLFKK